MLLILMIESVNAQKCQKGGCSGQLCIDPATDRGISNCMWKEEYQCYKMATCELQNATGKCGWTQTTELQKCISTARNGGIVGTE